MYLKTLFALSIASGSANKINLRHRKPTEGQIIKKRGVGGLRYPKKYFKMPSLPSGSIFIFILHFLTPFIPFKKFFHTSLPSESILNLFLYLLILRFHFIFYLTLPDSSDSILKVFLDFLTLRRHFKFFFGLPDSQFLFKTFKALSDSTIKEFN